MHDKIIHNPKIS